MLWQGCPWCPWLFGGCATLAFASQRIAGESFLEFNATRIIDGCYYQDRQYNVEAGRGHARMFTDVDLSACQRRCQREPDCQFFSFFRDIHVCWLAGKEAVFTAKGGHGSVAGPKFCPGVPSGCTERPGVGFPGATVTESELAFPSHRVPERFECWPRNTTGGLYGSCQESVVLEDTLRGWPGKCSGLQKVVVPAGESCESYCRKEVSCAVYQVVNDSRRTCLHSKLTGGSDCYMRVLRKPVHILEAKRIMHGRVRVLADTTGFEILGLQRAFDENYFLNVTRDAVPACRSHCYSNIGCQWWQYSRAYGCFVEEPKNPVEWPMTQTSWKSGTEFGATVIGGEYIQHLCPRMASIPAALRGMEVRPEDAQQLAPVTTLQGRVVVHGLFYGRLTSKQKVSLARAYAEDIVTAIGIGMAGIRNAQGLQGRVTLGQDATGTDATFFLNLPQATQAKVCEADVRHILSGQPFIRSIARTTRSIVGRSSETEPPLPKLEIVPSVMQTTLPPARWQSKWPVLDVPWYVVVLLGIALLFLLVGTLALCFAKPHAAESRGLKVPRGSGLASMSTSRGLGLLNQPSGKDGRFGPGSKHVRGTDDYDPAQDPLLMAELTSESSPNLLEAPESSVKSSSFADRVSAAKIDVQDTRRLPAPPPMMPLPQLLSLASEKAAILKTAFDAIEADAANDLTLSPSRPLLAGPVMSGLPPLPQAPQRSRQLLNLPGWLQSPRSPRPTAPQASPRLVTPRLASPSMALHAQLTPHCQSTPQLPSSRQINQTPLVMTPSRPSVLSPSPPLTVCGPTLTRHQSLPGNAIPNLHAPDRPSSRASTGSLQKLSGSPHVRQRRPSSTTPMVRMPLQRSPSAPPLAARTLSVMTPSTSVGHLGYTSPPQRLRRPSSLGNRPVLVEP